MWPLLCGLFAFLVALVVFKLFDYILRFPRVGNYSYRYIFITGCDSGFGHELAKRLDSLGCHVFAGCYTEKGETQLRKICSERVMPIALDVTNHYSVINAFELVKDKLQSAGNGLWGVLNNAGALMSVGPPEWMTADDYRQQCQVNLFGLIDVTMTFLPLLKKTRGRIVNTSSWAGFLTIPSLAPYSVSKYGVEAFTDALRRSLKPVGCKAVLIEPSGFKTSFGSNVVPEFERSYNKCSPELQVEYASKCAEMKRRLVTPFDRQPSDVSPVVDAYEHALLASFPRARYRVGCDAAIARMIAAVPEFIGDRLMKLKFKTGSTGR